MKKLLQLTTICAAISVGALSARAYTITYTTSPAGGVTPVTTWVGGNPPGNSDLDESEIKSYIGYTGTLTKLLDENVGGDTGDYTIDGPFAAGIATSPGIFLYVKDGAHEPFFYVFDISNWNRTSDIVLSGFWPGNGAISHVELLGGTIRPPGGGDNVPDGGTTLALLGLGLTGLGLARARLARK